LAAAEQALEKNPPQATNVQKGIGQADPSE
jgi:hypothetical protein